MPKDNDADADADADSDAEAAAVDPAVVMIPSRPTAAEAGLEILVLPAPATMFCVDAKRRTRRQNETERTNPSIGQPVESKHTQLSRKKDKGRDRDRYGG